MRTVLFLVGLALIVSAPLGAIQKPVVTTTLHLDGRSQIFTVDVLWARAPLIIEAVIESASPLDLPVSGGVYEQTEYRARVVETFKASEEIPRRGPTIELRRRGGDRDRGDHIERLVPDDYPLFQPGERYILFLRTCSTEGHTYYCEASSGADSVYRVIDDKTVNTFGKRDLSAELRQKGTEGLRRWLRAQNGRG